MAIGVIAVVMIVSGLRTMWRSDRMVRTTVSRSRRACVVWTDWAVMADPLLVDAGERAVADDGEEDVLEGGLLLDVLDLGGGKQRLELGEGAVGDDAAVVKDRDPVGELLGLVEVLRGQQDRGALSGELAYRPPDLEPRLRVQSGGGF